MTEVRELATDHGPARFVIDRAPRPFATLVLGHGAGRGVDTPELTALAHVLPRHGISVYRLEQPWVAQGKRVAPRGETLDAVLRVATSRLRVRTPLLIGGRSAGARSAVRQAKVLGAVGVVALAYPLHPPGKPERSREAELMSAQLPTLVVQGTRDPYGLPGEFPEHVELVEVPYADHGFTVGKRAPVTAEETIATVAGAVAPWVQNVVRARDDKRIHSDAQASATMGR